MTKPSKTRLIGAKIGKPLPLEEWDFSQCKPGFESEVCWNYELARVKYQELSGDWPLRKPLDASFDYFVRKYCRHTKLILSFEEFPKLPWLAIKAAKREKALSEWEGQVSSLIFHWGYFNEFMQQAFEQHEKEYGNRKEFIPCTTYGHDLGILSGTYAAIRLDWRMNDHQLREAFEKLLENRPGGRSEQRGRSLSYGDQLKALAAWRLLKHYKTVDKAKQAIAAEHKEAPYGDEENPWKKASARFDKIYQELIRQK